MDRKHAICPPPPEVLDEFGDSWDWRMPPMPTLFRVGHLVAVAVLVGVLSVWLVAGR